MKHKIIGKFSFEELTEIMVCLQNQETTDRYLYALHSVMGNYGNYRIDYDKDGNATVRKQKK